MSRRDLIRCIIAAVLAPLAVCAVQAAAVAACLYVDACPL